MNTGRYTKEFEEMLDRRFELSEESFKNELTLETKQLELQAMRNAGLAKEVDLLTLREKIEKATGRTLNDSEVEQLQKLIDLRYELNGLSSKTILTHGIITNELAQRGGFTSSVVMDDAEDVNQQLINNGRTANQLLTEIRDFNKKNGVIQ